MIEKGAAPLDLRDPASGRPLGVLLTRPDEQAEETAEVVRAAGGRPLLFPCSHRMPPPDPAAFLSAVAAFDRYDVVAVTSANAALALTDALQALGQRSPQGMRRPLMAAVGPRTAQVLAAKGLVAEVVAQGDGSNAYGLAAAIGRAIGARQERLFQIRVFFPCAAEARPALIASLEAAGATVTSAVAYRMVEADKDELGPIGAHLRAGEVDLMPFGSPRAVAIVISALGGKGQAQPLLARTAVGAIGKTTAQALLDAGVRVDAIGEHATFEALLFALSAHYRNAHRS